MPDREKVINCLNDIEQIMATRQEICPQEELQYWIELQEGVADALVLMKEQEAVEPIETGFKVPVKVRFDYECICGAPMLKDQPFCMECGRKVKWDA